MSSKETNDDLRTAFYDLTDWVLMEYFDLYVTLLSALTASTMASREEDSESFKILELPEDLFSNLSKHSARISRVYRDALLVYCHSILDSFLSTVTQLLLLSDPRRLKSDSIPWHEFLGAEREELINAAVEKRVRNQSYQGLKERLEYLKTLGLKFQLNPKVEELALLFIDWRNDIVHDLSTCKPRLTPAGLQVSGKSRRPLAVSYWITIDDARELYGEIIFTIVHALSVSLGFDKEEKFLKWVDLFNRPIFSQAGAGNANKASETNS